jgi:SOUL heme-binding protein
MRYLLLAAALFVFPSVSKAVEEPDYAVIRKFGVVEVRFYAPYAVAQVLVDGPEDEAGNQGFPILADYIFGKNKGEKVFSMTAPLTQVAASTRLEMMAPVTQAAAPGGFLVQFVLPKGVSRENAPEPIDRRIQLRTVPQNTLAAIVYSGLWSEANYIEHLGKLKSALRAANVQWTGEPIYARYNPPGTPWFMRRNEIWLALRKE